MTFVTRIHFGLQIWLPILSVSNKGQIRIEKDCNSVKSILRELTNLSQGSTLKANPRISASENVDTENSVL